MTSSNSDSTVSSKKPGKGLPIDPWLLVILIIAFSIRLYGITAPLVDFSSWRQVDTASIARNFAEHEFNILHPQLEYDGPGPNYGQLEFQITTFIIAILFKIGGVSDVLARIVPVFFFTGAVLFLYLLVKRYTDRLTANLAALIFAILPMGVFYGRAVQPEAAMLFFGIASLFYFSVWCEKQDRRSFSLAAVAGALSVLAKLPNIFLFIPVLAIAWDRFGGRTMKNWWIIIYYAIILGVTTVFFVYSSWLVSHFGSHYDYHNYAKPTIITGKFVSNVTAKHVIPQMLTAITSPEGTGYFSKFLPAALTPVGIILLLIGLIPFRVGFREHRLKPFYAWAGAMLLYAITIAAVIRIDYYLVPLLPIAAFFMARSLGLLLKYKATWAIAAILAGVIGYQSYQAVSSLYKQDSSLYKFGIELKGILRPHEPVILGSYNPAILYYSGHRGWRSNNLSLDSFEFLRSHGAGYYVPLNSAKERELLLYLKDHYKLHTTKSGCGYFDLKDQVH